MLILEQCLEKQRPLMIHAMSKGNITPILEGNYIFLPLKVGLARKGKGCRFELLWIKFRRVGEMF